MTNQLSGIPDPVQDSFDTGPLSWVIGEIRDSLARSKAAILDGVSADDEGKSTLLAHAKSYLHQAHGALQIVDVDGVAIITETVEDLLERIKAGQLPFSSENANAIERSYQAVVEYLEELMAGSQPQPVRLFPYYRQLLEVRGAERIHPADLFFPNLAIRPHLPANPTANKKADYTALRMRFEKALLPFLKSGEKEKAQPLLDIIATVEGVQENSQSQAFWWVMLGFAETVFEGQVPSELYVKQLFGRINLQIRRLAEGSTSISERLLRDALFFIARAQQPNARAKQIRGVYQLDGVVPKDYDKPRYGQIDVTALALAKDKLNQAKTLWSRIADDDANMWPAFEQEMQVLADASSKLNAPSLSKLLRELNGIARHAANGKLSRPLGLEIATNLLFVENTLEHITRLPEDFSVRADALSARLLSILAGETPSESAQWMDDLARAAQQRQTVLALATEMKANLRNVEKILDEYFLDPSKQAGLSKIDPALHQIAGALGILDQDDAMAAVQHTQAAVLRFANPSPDAALDPASERQAMQDVAQNLGALGFFIEMLPQNFEAAKSRFSFNPETGLYRANPIERSAVPATIHVDVAPLPGTAAHAASLDPAVTTTPVHSEAEVLTVEEELLMHQQQSAELAASVAAHPEDLDLQAQLKASLQQVRKDAALLDNPEAKERAQAAIDMLERDDFVASEETMHDTIADLVSPHETPAPSAAPVAQAAPVTDDAVDAELLEIFMMEADEVLAFVQENVPQSRRNPQNQDLLTTIRRSFHTLKGSGRMVGLNVFAEAAASIEQVMNLWLADAKAGNDDLYALLDFAAEELFAWVKEIEAKGQSGRTSTQIVNAANRLRAGGKFELDAAEVVVTPAPVAQPAPEPVATPAPEPEPVVTVAPLETPAPVFEEIVPQSLVEAEVVAPVLSEPEQEIPQAIDMPALPTDDEAAQLEVAFAAPEIDQVSADVEQQARELAELEALLAAEVPLVPSLELPATEEEVTSLSKAATLEELLETEDAPDAEAAHLAQDVLQALQPAHAEPAMPSSEEVLASLAAQDAQLHLLQEESAALAAELAPVANEPGAEASLLELLEVLEPEAELEAVAEAEAEAVVAISEPDLALTAQDIAQELANLHSESEDLQHAAIAEGLLDSPAEPDGEIASSELSLAEIAADLGAPDLEAAHLAQDVVSLLETEHHDFAMPSEEQVLISLHDQTDHLHEVVAETAEAEMDALASETGAPDQEAAHLAQDVVELLEPDHTDVAAPTEAEVLHSLHTQDLHLAAPDSSVPEAESLSLDEIALDMGAPDLEAAHLAQDVVFALEQEHHDVRAPDEQEVLDSLHDQTGHLHLALAVAESEIRITPPAPEVRDENIKQIGKLEISVPLFNIYLTETDSIVRLLAREFAEWRHETQRPVATEAVHAVHSLAGSSATVGFSHLQELAHALEMALEHLRRHPVVLLENEYDLLEHTVERIKQMLQTFAQGEMPAQQLQLVEQLENLQHGFAGRPALKVPEVDVGYRSTLEELEAQLLADEAELAQLSQLTQLENAQISDDSKFEPIPAQDAELPTASAAPELEDLLDGLGVETELAPQASLDATAAVELTEPEPHTTEVPFEELYRAVVPATTVAAMDAVPDSNLPDTLEAAEVMAEPHVTAAPVAAPEVAIPAQPNPVLAAAPVAPVREETVVLETASLINDELDADLLPVFIEEGRDLLPQVGLALRSWQQNPADTQYAKALLRLLHTVKGSARMAGAMRLGQHAHEIETRIENIMHLGPISPQSCDELLAHYDHSVHLFEVLQNPELAHQPAPSMPDAASAASGENVVAEAAPVRLPPPLIKTAVAQAPVPLVRVRADILDRLVNQAGEVSIARSKLENEVGLLRQSLTELTENIGRLRGQLREVEIQAESQITSRMAQQVDREFDPLEFDRFSRLQELTRMMAESVNDVASVQDGLARTVESATTDLAVQARLTRDLQQDLMRVRMVPFSSISERLFRVTRQAAKDVDKRVNLDIRGTSVEIDRSVLEKMAGPFEHLLRNAVAHGIETRAQRRAAEKSEIGELLVEIRQEGNEVVISFRDDGAGLNLTRIRAKAREVGLLGPDEEVSDTEAMNLVFEPGFSTQSELTELAGRGVGMDVVRSEAAGLGGRVEIHSEVGKGAQFTIHLPLTLAVTQVVLLSTGGTTYAVPSVLVEQVQQLKEAALANAYADGYVSWQGQHVPMHYLSGLLGDTRATPLGQRYSPVLILKSGYERVAVHVDEVLGNKEVVVKNIGPQLARMPGIAGATVLGSGDIVLILNPVPLAQRFATQAERRAMEIADANLAATNDAAANLDNAALPSTSGIDPLSPESEATIADAPPAPIETHQVMRKMPIVMVVDDSLTVRKVTQRFLVREGYQVVLAKDGVDALEQLQTFTPDVMLVDIEMPRMDGFDLTRNVRNDERTVNTPIIMITSRTADKHRNYALELGVNAYFGKPFQEDKLLEAISGFVKHTSE